MLQYNKNKFHEKIDPHRAIYEVICLYLSIWFTRF